MPSDPRLILAAYFATVFGVGIAVGLPAEVAFVLSGNATIVLTLVHLWKQPPVGEVANDV